MRAYKVVSLECAKSGNYTTITPEAAVERFYYDTGVTGKVAVYTLNKVGEFRIEAYKLVVTSCD